MPMTLGETLLMINVGYRSVVSQSKMSCKILDIFRTATPLFKSTE